MRIIENYHDEYELYIDSLKERVEEVFKYTSQITELRILLSKLKKECVKLSKLFLTDEEMKERKEMMDFFNTRMQSMAFYTIKNMEKYRIFGWKELIYDGDCNNEANI